MDDGYIIGASTYSFPTGNNNIYLVKVDSLGNVDWNWSFGNTNQVATQVADIIQLPDSSYVISGFYDSGSSPKGSGYIARLDKNGILLWIKRYVYGNNLGWESIHCLKLINNEIIASGVTRGYSQSGLSDGLLMSIDFNGNVNWSKTYGGTGSEWFYFLDIDDNQNITTIVYTNSVTFGSYDIGLIKTNLVGNVIDYKTFGSSGTEHSKFYSQTSDGGIIFTGNTTGFSAAQTDAYLIKVDSNWIAGCNESTATINSTSIILTPQTITASSNTNGNMASISLISSNISTIIDTLCITGPLNVNSLKSNPFNIEIYPNPSEGNFMISIPNNNLNDEINLSIYNVEGKLVIEDIILKGQHSVMINLSNYYSGLYFVKFSSTSTIYTQKILKK